MPTVTIHPAILDDVLAVANALREADRMELEHSSGLHYVQAVLTSARLSEVLYTAHIEGRPGIVFGVTPHGAVWMVCTDDVLKAKREVFDISKQILSVFLQRYPSLWNRADCRNKLHIVWIRKVGFTLGDIVEVNGLPYQTFSMTRPEEPPCVHQP